MKFPCDTQETRSNPKPTSVHKLRPGDIDIVGAIGDSLTAGFGITALNILQVFNENRGESFSIGYSLNPRFSIIFLTCLVCRRSGNLERHINRSEYTESI